MIQLLTKELRPLCVCVCVCVFSEVVSELTLFYDGLQTERILKVDTTLC